MTATLIDGKSEAQLIREEVARGVARLAPQVGRAPGLAVILVGADPASEIYVRHKQKAAKQAGMVSSLFRLAADCSQEALDALIADLCARDDIDGILCQLPLPPHLDAMRSLLAIRPEKDVDGFHPVNVGRLQMALPAMIPCTPLGCRLLLEGCCKLDGLHAVVVGRSQIVGKPMAALLLHANCTTTIVHSRTRNPQALCREADILVAALGRPKLIDAQWLKDGAIVVDVGINRLADGKIVGDVDFESASQKASFITPVPGGVGPMTIACLLRNCLESFARAGGLVSETTDSLSFLSSQADAHQGQ